MEIALLECKCGDKIDNQLEVMMAKHDLIMEAIVSTHQAHKKIHMDPHMSTSKDRS